MPQKNTRNLAAILTITLTLAFAVPALAQTNRVGVITFTYAISATGNGHHYWKYYTEDPLGGPPIAGGLEDSDDIQASISGVVRYEIIQAYSYLTEEMRIWPGKLLSSSAQQSVSGSESWTAWNPEPESGITPYFAGLFNPTNACVQFISPDGIQFVASCEEPVVMGISSGWDESRPWPWTGYTQGGACTRHGEDLVRSFQFTIPNPGVHSSQTLTTNVTVDVNESTMGFGSPDYWSGHADVSRTVTIQYTPDQATVGFTASPTNGFVPLTVDFAAEATDASSNAIVSWNWSFGDGTVGSGRTVSHVYTNARSFLVTLTATNNSGTAEEGVGPTNIVVEMPTVEFTAWPTNGWIPLAVQFSCPGYDSAGNELVGWAWQFGNVETAAVQNPSEIYDAPRTKTFSPKLTVTNSHGTVIVALSLIHI